MKEYFIWHQGPGLRLVLCSALIFLVLLGWGTERSGTSLAASPVTAVVECDVKTGTVSPLLFGINSACWDEQLFPGTLEDWPLTFDQIAVNRMKQAGIRFIRYPGGRDCDDYIWNAPHNSTLRMDTDEFMVLCRLTGAVPSITVNYTASPSLAAEWVRYANVEKGYAVPYWEVGDEEYFLVDATAYANRFLEFARAMKAVDPSIKVGANISPSRLDWSRKVLQKAGAEIDFVVHNWYPQGPQKEDDRSLLKTPRQLENDIALIRGLLKMEAPERAAKIEIQVGGYNSVSYAPGPQTVSMVNALWAADTLGTMASSGVAAAGYWALHNVYPPRGGDYGIMTSTPENQPYPVFHVFQLFKEHFGSTLAKTTVDDERISVYASTDGKAGEERLHVIIVNKAFNEVETLLDLVGVRPEMWGEVWLLSDEGGPRRRQDLIVAGGKGRLKIPAHTVTAVTFYGPHSAQPNPSNLARGKPVSASSTAEVDGMFRPESAVDGRMDTRWASRIWQKVPEWFQVDLGAAEDVEKVVLHWELEAVKFRVSLSQDGKNWRTVAEVTSSVGHGPEVVSFPASKARLVKLDLMERPEKTGTQYGHSLWTPWAFSLWEVEVYGPWQK
ncbi:MAG: hypothetical protein GX338_11495 [Firmicutes bacterium]|nr:hypothetical protein [Bacillota bacterium]